MKKIAALASLLALAAPTVWAASVELTITGVETASGEILIGVYDSETGWKTDASIAEVQADAVEGTVTVTLDGLPEGDVGIKLYHDVDSNGELKRGNFGIPAEPYGFSNDAPVRFGPPSWSAAKFAIDGETTTHTLALR